MLKNGRKILLRTTQFYKNGFANIYILLSEYAKTTKSIREQTLVMRVLRLLMVTWPSRMSTVLCLSWDMRTQWFRKHRHKYVYNQAYLKLVSKFSFPGFLTHFCYVSPFSKQAGASKLFFFFYGKTIPIFKILLNSFYIYLL